MMRSLVARVRQGIAQLDLYGLRGAAPEYHQGMRTLWLDNVLAAISGAFLFTYVPLYALALGASSTQIGTLSSAASLMGAVAPIPGAQLTERWGSRRRVVVAVWSIARAFSLAMLLIPFFLRGDAAVYAVIALWALRAGLANLAHPAWVSLSAEITPPGGRGRFFSSRNTAMALASMLFVPLAGQLIDSLGAPRGYQWSLGLSALFGYAALYFYAQIPEPAAAPRMDRRGSFAALWRSLTGNRTFLTFTLAMMLWNFALQMGGPFFQVYQVAELGSSTSLVGLTSMVMSFTRIIGQRYWGRIVDRRGSRWVMTVCALCIPAVPWIWTVIRRPWQVLFVSVPGGFVWAGFELASFSVLLELPAQEEQTRVTAGYTTLVNVASILGPMFGGWLVSRIGYRGDFAVSGFGRLLAALLFMWLLRAFRPREGTAPNVAPSA
ncbi:MAG TPA: MFS transporter [Anaerolineae bacterium]|nr:MFS transporter [Anaerolineae bacterium]